MPADSLIDSLNRKIDYLRLSVTDSCNLRCVYCLPENYQNTSVDESVLTNEENIFLLRCFSELGFSKIRITGGEPLLRKNLSGLIRECSKINGISDISLTTNGMLLGQSAKDLRAAGAGRINISLDSLKPEKFREITRYGNIETVLKGIEVADREGFSPIKINVVVARDFNEDEIGDFVNLTLDRPVHVRFIELMPMGMTGFFSKSKCVDLQEMMERAAPLEPLPAEDWPKGWGPARYYRRPGAAGTVGFISPLSCGFCSNCNRVRLSSKGILIPCLDGSDGTDLRTPLRLGAGPDHIKELISATIYQKPQSHSMEKRAMNQNMNPRMMCQIGG